MNFSIKMCNPNIFKVLVLYVQTILAKRRKKHYRVNGLIFSAHLWVLQVYNCLRIKCSPKNVDLQHCLLSQLWRQWRSPHLSQLTRSSRARLRTTSPATRMVTCSGHKMAPATSCWVRDPASTTAREEATLFYTEQANVLTLPRQKECF